MWERYGQHFLTSEEKLLKIVDTIAIVQNKHALTSCLEIWPWTWLLTKQLLDLFDNVIASEVDVKLQHVLRSLSEAYSNFHIIWWDVLELWIKGDEQDGLRKVEKVSWKYNDTMIVWNLPYYITSPILRRFFEQLGFWYGVFLIQHDVWIKLASDAKKRSYLRRLLNNEYLIQYEFLVPPSAFTPPPKVDSCVISIQKKEDPELEVRSDKERLQQLLDVISPFKRKTLRKIWKLRESQLAEWNFLLPESCNSKRLEELTRNEMRQILWIPLN